MSGETEPTSLWKLIGSAAGAKVVVMGLTGLLGMVNSRLIIEHFGVDAYTLYGLIAALPMLLPFADLGMAAVVLNAIGESRDPRHDEKVRRTLTTALRILTVSGWIIAVVAVLITLVGGWPILLGTTRFPDETQYAPMVSLVVFGLALPLSVGPRTLVGMGRTNLQIASTAITAPVITVGLLVLVYVVDWPAAGGFLAVLSYIASTAVLVLAFSLAAAAIRPQFRHAISDVPKLKSRPGVRAVHVAGPMLFQSLVLPIAMQSDRLLLSHLTGGNELAQYNLGSQLFGMIVQTVTTAGVALWPVYAKARAKGELLSPWRPALMFMGLGMAGALALTAVLGWLVPFITKDAFSLDGWLIAGFIAFVSLEALKYPLGMYMTDGKGLRFQVIPIAILVPLNIGISWWLVTLVGAGGPILGSAIAVLVCQVIPYALYVRKDLRRRRAEKAVADDAE